VLDKKESRIVGGRKWGKKRKRIVISRKGGKEKKLGKYVLGQYQFGQSLSCSN
jgi:hypothetical protein